MVARVNWRKAVNVALVLLLAAVSMVAFPGQTRAATDTFNPVADTCLDGFAANRDNNRGGSTTLMVQSKANNNHRTILDFDISSIPASQVISNARLKLYINLNTAAGRTYGVYRITETDWVEGTSIDAVEVGACSWNSRRHDEATWTTAGGVYTTDNGTTAVVPSGTGIWMEWDVTNQVRYAYTNIVDAHFLVKDEAEDSGSAVTVEFDSREGTNTPQLEVTYASPNQPPNIPTLNSPADGTTGVSTTPDLIFNYSDPDSDNCTMFDIQVDNNSDFLSPEINETDYATGGPWTSGSTITYPVSTNLSSSTQYFWKVRVNDGTAWSDWSDGSWDFTTAATTGSTSIEIRAQDYTTAVATITFPTAAPETEVANPANDQAQTQTFGGAGTAKPVVTLVNTADIDYTVWYNITTFTNSVVSNEYYLVNAKGAACADATAIGNAVTFGSAQSTGVTIAKASDGDTAQKDLYLKVTLGSVAVKSGNSTLTILGEAP